MPLRLDALRSAVERASGSNVIAPLVSSVRHLAAAAGQREVVEAAESAGGGLEGARNLVKELRRVGRSPSGGGLMVVHPDERSVNRLLRKAARVVGSSSQAGTIEEALELLDKPGSSMGAIVVSGVLPRDGVRRLVDRVTQDPALAHAPIVVCSVPQSTRLGLLARGVFECFAQPPDSDPVWECLSTLLGFEGVGIEMLTDDERLHPDRASFHAALRRTAERYLLDEGPEWCLAAFRVTNYTALEGGPPGPLADMERAICEAVLEHAPPKTLVGPLSTDEVGAVIFTHAPEGPAHALAQVRVDIGHHRVAGRNARPLLAGCVIHAGTASVPRVLSEARRLLKEARRSDAELRYSALSNDLRDLVLVVEDDDVFAALAELALESLGLGMIRAQTVAGALEIARTEARSELCLMLLDVGLPDSSGFDLLDQLREDSRLADVPAIFVSAHGSDRQVLEGLKHGADDYIVKPVAVQVLAAKIRATLARGIRGATTG